MSGMLSKLGLSSDSSSNTSTSSSSMSSSTSSSAHTTQSSTSATHGTRMAGSTQSGYQQPYTASAQTTTTTSTQPTGSTTTNDPGYMTRSEERLLVGKEQVGTGKASIDKHVTTEHVSTAVPITREHVVIEREPIGPNDRDKLRPDMKEAHYEVNLNEERAVAAKETVPVEKVRMRKEVEHTQQNVDADLRKEHIDFGNNAENTQGAKTLGAAPGTTGYSGTSGSTTTSKTTNTNTRAY